MRGTDLFCNFCYSSDIIQTSEGLVCRDCATVLGDLNFTHYRPHDDANLHDEPLRRLQMGTARERNGNGHSYKLSRLNKLNSIEDNEKKILKMANIEISRIFGNLDLPPQYKPIVFKQFNFIRSRRPLNAKYKAPEYLIPFITYFCCKINNISIKEKKLLEISNLPRIKEANHKPKIPQKLINRLKGIVLEFYPEYKKREKKVYILKLLEELRVYFHLELSFYYMSKQILYKLWNHINDKRDSSIIGEIASIVALCFFEDKISVHAICTKIGISPSTVQTRVKEDIFDYYKFEGFTSLKKSAGLLKKVLILLDVFEDEEGVKVYYDKVLKWIKRVPYFYVFRDIDHFMFAFKKSDREVLSSPFMFNNIPSNSQKPHNPKIIDNIIFQLDLNKYSVKGPPKILLFT